MFSFFKEEKLELRAFLSGKVIPIEEVEDETFSDKVLGDGLAIIPDNEVLVAPASGEITAIMKGSNHAIAMRLTNGMELLFHIGIETVSMNGEGFQVLVKNGSKVKQGDKLISFSKAEIKKHRCKDVTMMVITNGDKFPQVNFQTGVQAVANETIIASVSK
jgi:PTS system glucose-specific IIA component